MNYPSRVVCWIEESSAAFEWERPLMLEPVLFCPVLKWMSMEWQGCGVQRFFVVCSAAWAAEVRACFPEEADVTVSDDDAALQTFLAEEGDVAVFPSAALPLSGGERDAGCMEASVLRQVREGAPQPAALLDGWSAVRSLQDLQRLEMLCRERVVQSHLNRGVRMLDPSAVYIDPRAEIGAGTLLLPGTMIQGPCRIGKYCRLGPQSVIYDCCLGDRVEVNASQINESILEDGCDVGPYAHIRPNCRLGPRCHIGAFVQLKNSTLGAGTKMAHLTYVGDADVGERVNFGCGTITTNYDGYHKHRCTVEDDSFIGCNANLVSPVTVGRGAYIAAGTTVTEDVPPDALAVGRVRQENKDGWSARYRAANQKKKP